MSIATLSERGRIWRLVVQYAWQRLVRWLRGGRLLSLRPFTAVPARLLIAPQDLRTADATNAPDIYGGRFLFSGHLVESQGRSPFEIENEPVAWQRELHGFAWLRDLKAADSQIACQNARALVEDWIKHCGRWHDMGWETPVVTRRIISWLSHSPFILREGDHEFYRNFARSLARQARYLRRTINETNDGVERFQAALAIASASISMAGQGRYARQAIRRLDYELERQILADGGHVSRNPGALIEILADLLPVREALVAQGIELPPAMLKSVDRMMPMIRFFRHADGSLAHFNGMGTTPRDLLATVFAHDDSRGAPPANAPYSGFQRLTGGQSLVLMDTGVPSISWSSREAHAGCLSMEFSTGQNRIVVNCGVLPRSDQAWRMVARSTAAHSTVVIGDTSSCRFLPNRPFGRLLGQPMLGGPTNVQVEREDDATGTWLTASHDGYVDEFQTIHSRRMNLSADGTVLDGADTFIVTGNRKTDPGFAVRFHLHPAVRASIVRGGDAILLVCKDGEAWEFEAPGMPISLEESIYLSDVYGHRKTEQIVLAGGLDNASGVNWRFRKTATPKLSRRGTSDFDETGNLLL